MIIFECLISNISSICLQVFQFLSECGDIAWQKRRLLLKVLSAPHLSSFFEMFRHFVQFIFEFVTLDVQLHHVLLDSGYLLLFILGLGKFRIRFDTSTLKSTAAFLFLVVEASLEATTHHLRHIVALQLRLKSWHGLVLWQKKKREKLLKKSLEKWRVKC